MLEIKGGHTIGLRTISVIMMPQKLRAYKAACDKMHMKILSECSYYMPV